MTRNLLAGFDLDEVDTVAKELIEVLKDTGTTRLLATLGLSRALVMLSTEPELDRACRVIDELSTKPFDEVEY